MAFWFSGPTNGGVAVGTVGAGVSLVGVGFLSGSILTWMKILYFSVKILAQKRRMAKIKAKIVGGSISRDLQLDDQEKWSLMSHSSLVSNIP